jgi:hypothetical protein
MLDELVLVANEGVLEYASGLIGIMRGVQARLPDRSSREASPDIATFRMGFREGRNTLVAAMRQDLGIPQYLQSARQEPLPRRLGYLFRRRSSRSPGEGAGLTASIDLGDS